jgi:fatty-acyl-CoA synthase
MNLFGAIRREYIYFTTVARTLWLLRRLKPGVRRTIVDIVEEWARKTPDAPAIFYQDTAMSYGALDKRANQYAHWALSLGLVRGDAVSLLMENRPDFLCAWLGLFKAGLSAALINTNQRGAPLAHSVEIVGCRHVIAGQELSAAMAEADPFFTVRPQVWTQGEDGNLDLALNSASTVSPGPAPRVGVTLKDQIGRAHV